MIAKGKPRPLESYLDDLPSPPTLIKKLQAHLSDEDVSAHVLARLIETDQGLSARLLRVVNSPFYGFSRDICSIEEAITLVGVNTVKQLSVATATLQAFGDTHASFDINGFWLHSFAVAVLAKQLISKKGRSHRDQVFIGGLLHDIGRLALVKIDAPMFLTFRKETADQPVTLDEEREYFGVDHQALGGALARRWNLPAPIRGLIENHHRPDPKSNQALQLAAVNNADMICHALSIGFSGTTFVTDFFPASWKLLEIDNEELRLIVQQALHNLSESKQMLVN